jgi:hypothetical protein
MNRVSHEVIDSAAVVASDERTVIFPMSIRRREVEVSIARDALETCFWLPRGANEIWTLRAVENGRQRITAIAQRKLLARPDGRLSSTVDDFVTR